MECTVSTTHWIWHWILHYELAALRKQRAIAVCTEIKDDRTGRCRQTIIKDRDNKHKRTVIQSALNHLLLPSGKKDRGKKNYM